MPVNWVALIISLRINIPKTITITGLHATIGERIDSFLFPILYKKIDTLKN
jgi:hypothetical protein